MDFISLKKVQFVIITCFLFETSFSASLFGLDFSAPKKVLNTPARERFHLTNPSMLQYSNPLFGGNQYPSLANTNKEAQGFSFPTPGRTIDTRTKVKAQEPLKTYTPEKGKNGASDPCIEKTSLNQKENHVTDDSKFVSEDYKLGWSETGTEDTTSTSEYETTTDEPLNRIGGAPPAVVASLLG